MCCILCFCGHAHALEPAIYLFGSSVLDMGNNNYIPTGAKANYYPYGIDFSNGEATGRFTNGKNAMDFIVEMLGVSTPKPSLSLSDMADMAEEFLKGVNFASGGAGVLDSTYMIGIVKTYQHISNSFIVINIGNNDITVASDTGVNPDKYASLLISTLRPNLKNIYFFGGHKFVTISSGAQGCLPMLRAITATRDCHKDANLLAKAYNKRLASLMEELQLIESYFGELHYSFFDLFAAHEILYKSRETLGFGEGEVACCGTGPFNGSIIRCTPGTVPCSNRTDHIYWDNVHYTERFTGMFMKMAFGGSAPYVYPINVKQLRDLPSLYLHTKNVELAIE
ncbi:hypothetical protein J5N97_011333 [Dioscorea zingiberensis]|uniref:GDSL esterase/lipase n=1 Tax=Dioscorea zingiberensis TaxID=325984 RepID=A0A9D5D2U5_9LILI|nr:hypothetical protein J5N97_011333 [Dioscorea zingiberensis]